MPISQRDIALYKKRSEQFERESRRLDQWIKLMPYNQPFPAYERASLKHAYFKHKKLTPIWNRIRSTVLPNGKTLWQKFPLTTEHDPPLFKEIASHLKIKRKTKQVRLV